MQLSILGHIVREEWFNSTKIRKEILLHDDEFVVMPNHIHGIVWIVEANTVPPAGIDIVNPLEQNHRNEEARHTPIRMQKSLSSFVAGYKSSVTGRAKRELGIFIIWQRNFFDHIIRNEKEFHNIWRYIDNNPQQWQDDQLHPSATSNKFTLS
ncbi:MAG: hypothetical protein JW908_12120 [Anaerolineales bacterium]|nr:hypothetical protein [Anaerolineales bacterium]